MASATLTINDSVANRLEHEPTVWLTTVSAGGTPAPTPVWFLWSNGEFLIFSEPDKPKLVNVGRNPRVALNFNGTKSGGNVSVFTGSARIDADGPTPEEWEQYVQKYASGLRGLGYSAERFRSEYSVLLRVEPERLRGW
jgi:PPOX class probable F420-dependent enzyme